MSNGDQFSEGIHFYFNESGYMVFTEKYHLERGYCCGQGCKHCPYDYENVHEPLKSKLSFQKINEGKEY